MLTVVESVVESGVKAGMEAPIDRVTASTSMVLGNISWETFQRLTTELESQPSKRLTYNDGVLEIWMPLPPHEKYKKFMARFVELITEELDIEVCSLGSTTWRRKDLLKGVEADECYYIQNEAIVRGKMEFDLTIDPAPELAIEVDMTSLSIPRLPIYATLGVGEIWRFDGEIVELLQLVNGDYESLERSQVLPIVTPAVLLQFLIEVQEMGETSWAKKVRSWVRDNR
jgi:Uma2 family endonuclease